MSTPMEDPIPTIFAPGTNTMLSIAATPAVAPVDVAADALALAPVPVPAAGGLAVVKRIHSNLEQDAIQLLIREL